jgi:catalase
MVWHLLLVDEDYGRRVGGGLGLAPADVAGLEPLPDQVLTDEDAKRLANLGNNQPRALSTQAVTGSVPNHRVTGN